MLQKPPTKDRDSIAKNASKLFFLSPSIYYGLTDLCCIMNDCSDMTKDGCIKQRAYNHHENTKAFLIVCLSSNIAKTNGGHTSHGEVECSQISGECGRATSNYCGIG